MKVEGKEINLGFGTSERNYSIVKIFLKILPTWKQCNLPFGDE